MKIHLLLFLVFNSLYYTVETYAQESSQRKLHENLSTIIEKFERTGEIDEEKMLSYHNEWNNYSGGIPLDIIKSLLLYPNDSLTVSELDKIIDVSLQGISITDKNFNDKIIYRKILLYQEYLSVQKLNLKIAEQCLYVGDYERAKNVLFEIFSTRFHKFHFVGMPERNPSFSTQLFLIQKSAYRNLLNIAAMQKDRELLVVLKRKMFNSFYQIDGNLKVLNQNLKEFNIDTIPKSASNANIPIRGN